MCRRRYPLWWSKRRSKMQPQGTIYWRAWTFDKEIHNHDTKHHRPIPRCPSSRRLHRCTDDGLDYGYLQPIQRILGSRDSDRKTSPSTRVGGKGSSNLTRINLLHTRGDKTSRNETEKRDSRCSGVWKSRMERC